MRKLAFILGITLLCAPIFAQSQKEIMKERMELQKLTRSALKNKASKDARKEAKRLIKEKWESAPGALPIERQLDRSYMMQMEYDADGFPKYLMGEAMR